MTEDDELPGDPGVRDSMPAAANDPGDPQGPPEGDGAVVSPPGEHAPDDGENGPDRDSPEEGAGNGEIDGVPAAGEEESGDPDGEGEGGDPALDLPLASVVEAVLFAAREPLKPVQIARAVGKGTRQDAVREAVVELNVLYLETSRAFEIAEISGRFQLMSRPEYAGHLVRLYPKRESADRQTPQRLTPAALDTLSIIAYKQPVTRAEIERVRGVGCGPVLRALLERGTIRVAGKLDVVGKPPLYGTTEAFLVEFGLGSLDELPLRNDFLNAFPELRPSAGTASGAPAGVDAEKPSPENGND